MRLGHSPCVAALRARKPWAILCAGCKAVGGSWPIRWRCRRFLVIGFMLRQVRDLAPALVAGHPPPVQRVFAFFRLSMRVSPA